MQDVTQLNKPWEDCSKSPDYLQCKLNQLVLPVVTDEQCEKDHTGQEFCIRDLTCKQISIGSLGSIYTGEQPLDVEGSIHGLAGACEGMYLVKGLLKYDWHKLTLELYDTDVDMTAIVTKGSFDNAADGAKIFPVQLGLDSEAAHGGCQAHVRFKVTLGGGTAQHIVDLFTKFLEKRIPKKLCSFFGAYLSETGTNRLLTHLDPAIQALISARPSSAPALPDDTDLTDVLDYSQSALLRTLDRAISAALKAGLQTKLPDPLVLAGGPDSLAAQLSLPHLSLGKSKSSGGDFASSAMPMPGLFLEIELEDLELAGLSSMTDLKLLQPLPSESESESSQNAAGDPNPNFVLRTAVSMDSLELSGKLRLHRTRSSPGWEEVVTFALRVDKPTLTLDISLPLLRSRALKLFAGQLMGASSSMDCVMAAFASAPFATNFDSGGALLGAHVEMHSSAMPAGTGSLEDGLVEVLNSALGLAAGPFRETSDLILQGLLQGPLRQALNSALGSAWATSTEGCAANPWIPVERNQLSNLVSWQSFMPTKALSMLESDPKAVALAADAAIAALTENTGELLLPLSRGGYDLRVSGLDTFSLLQVLTPLPQGQDPYSLDSAFTLKHLEISLVPKSDISVPTAAHTLGEEAVKGQSLSSSSSSSSTPAPSPMPALVLSITNLRADLNLHMLLDKAGVENLQLGQLACPGCAWTAFDQAAVSALTMSATGGELILPNKNTNIQAFPDHTDSLTEETTTQAQAQAQAETGLSLQMQDKNLTAFLQKIFADISSPGSMADKGVDYLLGAKIEDASYYCAGASPPGRTLPSLAPVLEAPSLALVYAVLYGSVLLLLSLFVFLLRRWAPPGKDGNPDMAAWHWHGALIWKVRPSHSATATAATVMLSASDRRGSGLSEVLLPRAAMGTRDDRLQQKEQQKEQEQEQEQCAKTYAKAAAFAPASDIRDGIIEGSIEYTLPLLVRWGIPLLMIGNIALYNYSNSVVATTVQLQIFSNGEAASPKMDIFSFDLKSTIDDMFGAKVYPLAFLIAFFSGGWPYVKIVVMAVCWFVPPSLLNIQLRGRLLYWLDVLGKWSLIDTFVMVLMTVSFAFTLPIGPMSVVMSVKALPGFYTFLGGTMLSLCLGHYLLWAHRYTLGLDDGSVLAREMLAVEEKTHGTRNGEPSIATGLRTHVFHTVNGLRRVTARGTVAICVLLLLDFCLLFGGVWEESFGFKFLGLTGGLLSASGMQTISYSVFSLYQALPEATGAPDAFPTQFMVTAYLLFTLVVPSLLIIGLAVAWLVPLKLKIQRPLARVLEVLNCWCALDVFCVAITAALLEIQQLAAFIVGDKCDSINAFIEEYIGPKLSEDVCFDVQAFLMTNSAILFSCSIMLVVLVLPVLQLVTAAVNQQDERQQKALVQANQGMGGDGTISVPSTKPHSTQLNSESAGQMGKCERAALWAVERCLRLGLVEAVDDTTLLN